MSDNNYVILKHNYLDKTKAVFVTSNTIKDNFKGSIVDFANKSILGDNAVLEVGDVIYELKPVIRVHTQITASKVKSL